MDKGINLISLETRKTLQYIKLKKKVRSVTIVLVVLFIVFSLGVFGALQLYGRKVSSNTSRITFLENEVKAMEKIESYLVTIADRTAKINKLDSERKPYLGLFDDLETFLITGFSLEGLSLSQNGTLTVIGTCSDSHILEELNQQAEALAKEKKYNEISFTSVSRTEEGRYGISLRIGP